MSTDLHAPFTYPILVSFRSRTLDARHAFPAAALDPCDRSGSPGVHPTESPVRFWAAVVARPVPGADESARAGEVVALGISWPCRGPRGNSFPRPATRWEGVSPEAL